jgi:hypothetical protein
LIDLERRSIERLDLALWACDWWDRRHILCQSTNHDIFLYDVTTRTRALFIAHERIGALFRQRNLRSDPSKAQPFAIWNGRENDFYLTDAHQKWLAEESFLIKLERPGGTLKLTSPEFKFEWSDHLDPSGRKYLYSGREAGEASDGVFVRELADGRNRVLVDATTNKYFSIPRFYRDSVIYVRSNALWQIRLDGSNNVRLFPPQ